MTGRFLAYFADPMCSWCYGFGPELAGLLEHVPGTRLDLVMGGLRPYNTERASPAFRAMIREHWRHVGEQSGLPFNDAALSREGFVYDTEPACRAVVAARGLDADRALGFFRRVQSAFYAEGRDVTDPDVLGDLASAEGFDRGDFSRAFASEESKAATRRDFLTAQETGVTGFPTLAVGYPDGQFFLLSPGFARTPELIERLARIDEIATREQPPRPAG